MSDSAGVPVSRPIEREEEVERGARIGPYRIEDRLAAGGMGVVYRASRADGDGPAIALKILRRAHLADEERRRRFVREARLAASLEHPGIVRVLEVGEADGVAFLAMELVAGRSLRAWLGEARARGSLPVLEDALALARGIAEAVAFAHERGVIHRDLKPDNVMVVDASARLEIRVLDFGLAKLREAPGGALYEAETETSLTNDGRVLGTPGYMAPEQAAGKEIGFRADVFALGAILYELLTGARAFVGSSPMDVIVSASRDEPSAPSTKNRAVSTELDALVARCLAKSPDARPTMKDVAEALARPGLRARGPVSSARARRVAAVVLACVGAAALAIGASRDFAARSGASADAGAREEASAAPTSVIALPRPQSTVPAALEAYDKAIRFERDGDGDDAQESLELAAKLDPDLAAAHLRLALRRAFYEAERARAHYAQAAKLRDRLSPRDRDVLDAAKPLFQRDPPDLEAWRSGFETLAARYPGDAELAYELSTVRDSLGDFVGSAEAAKSAIALDPRFGLALSELAAAQAYAGSFDAARATLARCLEVTPAASWCGWVLEFIDGLVGRCAELETNARQRIASEPTVDDGYKALFFALGGLGRPAALLREARDQAVAHTSDPWLRRRLELDLSTRLASYEGDFGAAAKLADDLRAHVATRSDIADHARATVAAADIQREIGHPDVAGAIAKDFLDRREVWQAEPVVHDYALSVDTTPAIAGFALRAGKISKTEHDALLGAWRAKYDAVLHGHYREYLWVYGWAAIAETPEDGAAAVAALAGYEPIPPFLPDGTPPPTGPIGRALWLGGREAQGLGYLEIAARTCDAGSAPRAWVREHAWLADAYAKRGQPGDKERACAELDVVLARWGHARPRSVTADAARARARSLGCAR